MTNYWVVLLHICNIIAVFVVVIVVVVIQMVSKGVLGPVFVLQSYRIYS